VVQVTISSSVPASAWLERRSRTATSTPASTSSLCRRSGALQQERCGTRVLLLLLIGASGAITAAESAAEARAIDIPAGATVYFQLLDSASGNISPVIRVENPNRDYFVVRAVLDADARTLRIHNGYEDALSLAMNAACPPANKVGIRFIIKPGAEAAVQLAASTTKVVLCEFRTMGRQAEDGGRKFFDSLRGEATSQ